MRPEDLTEWLRRLPFRPFRLHVLETTAYEVHHAEMAIVKRSTVDLFFTAAQPLVPLAERRLTIALLHISRLEVVVPAETVEHNGG